MAVLQELDGTLQVALILVEATGLACIDQASLESQNESPATQPTINVLFKIVEELDKAELARHVGCIVVQRRTVKEGMFSVPGLVASSTS